MSVENKCSLDNMLTAILGIANTEKNQSYPPSIYQSQYNTATAILINAIVDKWPSSQAYIDVIEPFLKTKIVPISNGVIEFPEDQRNFLDACIFLKKTKDGECSCDKADSDTLKSFNDAVRRNGCSSRPVEIVNQSEWDYRTTSEYNYPDYMNPIGCFFGKQELKICPFDIERVQIRYIRNESQYVYGYTMQPDDTFVFDATTSVESEWTNAAFKYLFNAIASLYAAYTRNTDLRDWTSVISKQGIL